KTSGHDTHQKRLTTHLENKYLLAKRRRIFTGNRVGCPACGAFPVVCIIYDADHVVGLHGHGQDRTSGLLSDFRPARDLWAVQVSTAIPVSGGWNDSGLYDVWDRNRVYPAVDACRTTV